MTDVNEKEWGRMLSDIEYIKRDIDEIKNDHRALKTSIDTLTNLMSEARGHWKALLIFGSFCSVVGGLAVKLFSYIRIW